MSWKALILFLVPFFCEAGMMSLQFMNDEVSRGAVCLDGTVAGFYFQPSPTGDRSNWQIYFEGGGWCYDEVDCLGRSTTTLGTLKGRPLNISLGGQGIISDDCNANPDFCNFNRVYLPYCDGNSFSGNRDEPVYVNNVPLYFRGRRILDAVFAHLKRDFGFGAATTVLLTGCSAGGLSTFLHADYVGTLLPTGVTKYRAAPISGFFLWHLTVENQPVYATEMRYIFHLANSTGGLNDACVASNPGHEYRCMAAQGVYPYIKTPIFLLNSGLDSWQVPCVLTSRLPAQYPNQTGFENGVCNAVPSYKSCVNNPESCSAGQTTVLNQYIADFMTTLNTSATYTQPGNGGFFSSCYTHCEAQSDQFFVNLVINGVTMRDAVHRWWASDGTEPAVANTYLPCLWLPAGHPKQCNPTCG